MFSLPAREAVSTDSLHILLSDYISYVSILGIASWSRSGADHLDGSPLDVPVDTVYLRFGADGMVAKG